MKFLCLHWNSYLLVGFFCYYQFYHSYFFVSGLSMSSSSPPSSSSSSPSPAAGIIDFLTMARGLKTTPRTGWVRQEANPRIESVADHSWRITLMSMIAASSSSSSTATTYDTNKCIKMALVHDLAEATVGDITPHCGVSDNDKHKMELEAMTKMVQSLGTTIGGGGDSDSGCGEVGKELLELWKEYEQGTSEEAKLVKDMDKLEMILQALEYENDGKNGKSLDGFFDSTRNKWRTPVGESWGKEIEARRRQKAKLETTTTDEQPDDKKQKTETS